MRSCPSRWAPSAGSPQRRGYEGGPAEDLALGPLRGPRPVAWPSARVLACKREKCEIDYAAAPTPYSPSVGTHARGTDRKAAWSSLSVQNAKNAVTGAHFFKSGCRARDMRSYSPMPMHGV